MIPFILHQIAADEHIPAHLTPFTQSWSHWNSDLKIQLWTDTTLRTFITKQAPEFLDIYNGYRHGVCRADLGRYLVLQHFGGIYADLDCQCLKPIKPLLEGRQLVIAQEPEEHHNLSTFRESKLKDLVCNAFIASTPNHPIWLDVLNELKKFNPKNVISSTNILEATGPFLLSRIIANKPNYKHNLVPPELIYPFSKNDCWEGKIFDLKVWSERTQRSYVVHHWDGSWFRTKSGQRSGVPEHAPVNIQNPTENEKQALNVISNAAKSSESDKKLPLISCLMVTRGRYQQARLSIASFLKQTYPNRELVVLDDDSDSRLSEWIKSQANPLLRLIQLPDERLPLGKLRNFSVDHARGEYVCQWDDDDLNDPLRLEVQLQTMLATDSQASLLARWMIWWPQSQRLALSCYRDWEGSLLCMRSLMPRYPSHFRRGEDTIMLQELIPKVRLARVDLPRLYLYVVHGANTFEANHFENHWKHATAQWEGRDLQRLWPELQRRLPMTKQYPCD